ncbi:MAG TPA: DNA polymerase III subunit delta' [Candidatus Polarisedimenticolaceae bacterium]|nr:DNA polymerase III subunit delta' [Candidatus Polarisedimenticolaceae bacterium]
MEPIVGQTAVVELLDGIRASGRVPHGLLLQGPDGVGKRAVARRFAAGLLCDEPAAAPCGRCESCRLVDRDSHPDLAWVRRLPKVATGTETAADDESDLHPQIKVDQIRELTRLLAMAARRGGRRVAILDPADRMNREAQNALLKTLEEPPGRAVLVLLASRPHLLLPTVRSRSFVVGVAALRVSELARLLVVERGMDRDEALTRAALAEGRPRRALDLDLDAERARREGLLLCLERLGRGGAGIGELPDLATAVAGRTQDDLVDNLDMLEALLRDAARASLDAEDEALVHADEAPRLARIGERLGVLRAAELTRGIERLERDLRVNVNRTLVAEAILAAVAGGPLP